MCANTLTGADRPDRRQGPAQRRRRRRSRPRHGRLPHRRPAAQDRRHRHPRRHLGRSGRRRAHRRADPPAVAGDRLRSRRDGRQLRFGLQLRLFLDHLLALGDHAGAQGINPRLVFERLFGSGADADRARRERNRRSILDFVREDASSLAAAPGAATITAGSTNISPSIRDIEERIERAAQHARAAAARHGPADRHPARLSASTSA